MRNRHLAPSCWCTLLLLLTLVLPHTAQAKDTILVFAAASTTDAINEVAALYASKARIVPSYASSSTLAKQIDNGAQAQIFISANAKWMDFLQEKQLLQAGSRSDLLYNRLALIAPAQNTYAPVQLQQGTNLVALLGPDGRLALGDPQHVPVGMYAEKALKHLHIWDSIHSRLAPAKDVRAGLALVARGEAPLGIVYASDTVGAAQVQTLALFPEDSHPPITYPVALIRNNATPAAQDFLQFLKGDAARQVFKKYGFDVK